MRPALRREELESTGNSFGEVLDHLRRLCHYASPASSACAGAAACLLVLGAVLATKSLSSCIVAAGVVIGANLDAARRLGAAPVRGMRAARREGAAGGQPHERGRVALDGREGVLLGHDGVGGRADKVPGVGVE